MNQLSNTIPDFSSLANEDKIKKEEEIAKISICFNLWCLDNLKSKDGYKGEVPQSYYLHQEHLKPLLKEKGWESTWYTKKEWAWSMTSKDEYEYSVYKVEIWGST